MITHNGEVIYNVSQLAEMLGTNRVTIWRWRNVGMFPEHDLNISNTRFWYKKTIDQWLPKREIFIEEGKMYR